MLIKPMIQVKRITKSVSTSEGALNILYSVSLDILAVETVAINCGI